jgi:hypothetical protein
MRSTLFAVLLLVSAAPALAKPPIWDRKIDTPKRFKVLKAFDAEAVLDQETGLVWEREPEAVAVSWSGATPRCVDRVIAGRGGWRLPTASEMRSLVNATLQVLPTGHPFTAPDSLYWTSTLVPGTDTLAYVGDLGIPNTSITAEAVGTDLGVWCVRGPSAGGL